MKRMTLFLLTAMITLLPAVQKVIVFHAGSLAVPFSEIEKRFEAKYPQYDVVREVAGSRACARKITDIKKPADVMASADYKVIDNLLIPEYAKFNARFATNEMVIAYTQKSRFSKEITTQNWPQILLRKEIKVGHSNPNLDPCGYRSVLVAKLAERYYGLPGFYQKLMGYGQSYRNGEEKKGKMFVRPKETDLLALLESAVIDYFFIYRSVAMQHGLPFVELPDAVNLGSASKADLYARVSFDISGKKPGSYITKKGAPMVYGVTIVENGKELPPNPEGAKRFIRFLFSDEGQKIMKKSGQGVISPPVITGDASRLEP